MSSRHWVVTCNNYTEADENEYFAVTLDPSCKCLWVGKEVGEEKGTPHLQGAVSFFEAKSFEQMKRMFTRADLEQKSEVSTFAQMYDYTAKGQQSKDEWHRLRTKGPNYGLNADVFQHGMRPMDPRDKGEAQQERAKRNLAAMMEGRLEDVDPTVVASSLSALKFGAMEMKKRLNPQLPIKGPRGTRHEWHWGVPNAGKTTYPAREWGATHSIYKHASDGDKWWDDYNFEDITVIEDVDESYAHQARFFKFLLDQEPFRAQVKGSSLMIRPGKVIVTSNFHPRQIWKGVHLEAILSRLGDRIYYWGTPYGSPEYRRPYIHDLDDIEPSPVDFEDLFPEHGKAHQNVRDSHEQEEEDVEEG